MTAKTRYFVIASLLVLVVGLGTGLLAYYVGLPGGFLTGRDGPDELKYVPRNAAVVAYADVRDIMASDVRQRIRRAIPLHQDGQRHFQEQTGIDIESDIDHVVASMQPLPDGTTGGFVLARGRFNEVTIEALMREHGAQVEEYGGKRIIAHADVPQRSGDPIALSFLEPGLVALGSTPMIRGAIDLQKGGENVTGNAELMDLMRPMDNANAWAIGRLDALVAGGRLPAQVAARLPAVNWFTVSGRVDSEVRGVVRAETRDEEAGNNLRDVVRGFLALANLSVGGSRPEMTAAMQAAVRSLELGGTGKSVVLSFVIPGAVFDAMGARAEPAQPGQ